MPNSLSKTTSHLVMAKDLNSYGSLFGGQIVYWMDELAVILAMQVTGKECVTMSFDKIAFKQSLKVNDVLTLKADVFHQGLCSLKIKIAAYKTHYNSAEEYVGESIVKFAALDADKKPTRLEEPSSAPLSSIKKAS
ncbi:MAG: acyl-CoA thioesterase [Alphaproteobacteria bacterium]